MLVRPVGTATGLAHLHDIASHQLLRTISTHKGMSISHLATTMLKPPDLIGHVSLSLKVGSFSDAKDVIPVRPVVPFYRVKDAKARDAHEVMMMLPVQVEVHVSSDQTNSTAYAGIDPWRYTQRV
jgi:pre-rRNA-processing protein IPI3